MLLLVLGYFFTLQDIFYIPLESFKKENFNFFSFCDFSNVLLCYQKFLTLALSIFYLFIVIGMILGIFSSGKLFFLP